MKVKVFDKGFKPPEKKVLLAMEENRIGGVDVFVVDKFGERETEGHLLNIDRDGVTVLKGVSERFGFKLDSSNALFTK